MSVREWILLSVAIVTDVIAWVVPHSRVDACSSIDELAGARSSGSHPPVSF